MYKYEVHFPLLLNVYPTVDQYNVPSVNRWLLILNIIFANDKEIPDPDGDMLVRYFECDGPRDVPFKHRVTVDGTEHPFVTPTFAKRHKLINYRPLVLRKGQYQDGMLLPLHKDEHFDTWLANETMAKNVANVHLNIAEEHLKKILSTAKCQLKVVTALP